MTHLTIRLPFQLEKNNSILESYDRDLKEFQEKEGGGGGKGGGSTGGGDDSRVKSLEKDLEEAKSKMDLLQQENDALKEQLKKMGVEVSCCTCTNYK